MSAQIRFESTSRGKQCIFDVNNYKYRFNNSSIKVNNWICVAKTCKARLRTRISTDNLLNENLPEHDHGNNLLKDSTQCAEDKVIRQMANVPGVTTKAVLSEINRNEATHVSSQRSTAAVKIALWRQKCKVNPISSIPKDFTTLMDMEIPREV